MHKNKSTIESKASQSKCSKQSLKIKLRKTGYLLMSSAIFAALVLVITYNYLGSPKERLLKEQNQEYAEQFLFLNQEINKLEKKLSEIENRDDNLYRTMCNLEPISTDQRKVGYGGSDRYMHLKAYKNAKQIIFTYQRLDRLGRKLYVQSRSFEEVNEFAINKKKMLASIPAIQPISVNDLTYISSFYGYRNHPKLHRWIKHAGVDFAALKGTPIYATGNGIVKRLNSSMSNYGKVVVIDHGFNYESLYAHMSKRIVVPGDTVKRGQVIGYVGRTGRVTGVHLHYEVLKNGKSVNPTRYFKEDLSADEYDKMILVLSLFN